MDPFSITVGAIALAGATRKAVGGIKQLKALRDAPEELQDLLTELSQFDEIIQAIQDTAHASESADSALVTLLGRAKDKIVEFNLLIEYRLTQAGSSSKVDRLRWIVSQKDIDRLRKQLSDIRANLDVIIGVRTSTTVQHTLKAMRKMHSENQELRRMAACLPQILEEVQSTGSTVTGFLNNFPHHTLQSSPSNSQSVVEITHNSISQIRIDNTYVRSSDHLQLQRTYNVTRCHSDCLCKCHRTTFSWRIWSLARIFGRAYLESKGPSWMRAPRHIQSCKASASTQIRVIYFIPTWIAMKAIYIRYTSSPLHSPEWLIRIPRLVDEHHSPAFKSIYKDDFSAFRSAIASGECMPYDVGEHSGSILSNIVSWRRYDMLKYLVGIGVDVLQPMGVEDYGLDFVWSGLVENLDSVCDMKDLPLQDLIPQFPWDEYKERYCFTLLHEIVCCISGRDLDNAAQTHPADINRLDYRGRSPLIYAIRDGSITAVRTLLRRGADPDVSDGMPMRTALRFANIENVAIIELLLCSGATINGSAGDHVGARWIWSGISTDEPRSLAVDRLLVEHGIDVNHQVDGRTLLMNLCSFGSVGKISMARMEHLVSHGANLELRSPEGHTALLLAIAYLNPNAMNILLHAGARLDVKTKKGDTVLHLAVTLSNSSNFAKAFAKAFFETGLARLNLELENEDGYTAYDLLRKRNGLRWENYYKKFCWSRKYRSIYAYTYPEWLPGAKNEYRVILALEALLHQIQDSQGVPKDQQYPPLGPFLSDDKDEEPVPGAWPV